MPYWRPPVNFRYAAAATSINFRHASAAAPNDFRYAAAAAGAYLAILVAVLGSTVSPLTALAGGDWTDLLYPFFRFTHDTYTQEGRLPFWNPYIFSGQPHLVSLNVLALYPTELLSLFVKFEPSVFYAIDVIAHLWLAGVAMFWWLRWEGRSASAAFTAGLCYMLGAHMFTLAGAGHPHWIRCLAWLPLIFAFIERGKRETRTAWYVAAGVCLAMTGLTAAMQFAACTLAVIAVWTLGGPRAGLSRRAGHFAVMAAVAGGLSAVVWLPGFEYYTQSVRATASEGFAAAWSLKPWDLVTIFLPELWGTSQIYFGPHLFRLSGDYPGLLTIALAFVGGFAVWRRGGRRWIWLAAAGALLAFGPATPPGEWLGHLPVFSGFRTSLRWLSFSHLAVCVLVAYGWDDIEGRGRRIAMVAAATLTVFAVGALGLSMCVSGLSDGAARRGFVRRHLEEGRIVRPDVEMVIGYSLRKGAVAGFVSAGALAMAAAPGTFPFLLRAAAVWGVLATDLLVANAGYFTVAPATGVEVAAGAAPAEIATGVEVAADAVADFLADREREPFRCASGEYLGLRNRRMRYDLEWVTGYHGLPLERYRRVSAAVTAVAPEKYLSMLGVRYLVTDSGAGPAGWRRIGGATGVDGAELSVLRNDRAFPRAFLAHELLPCADLAGVVLEMLDSSWSPLRVPTDSPVPASLAGRRLGTGGTVVLENDGDAITASLRMKEPGLLVFSEVWYPAWKANINGVRVPIIRAYGAFRALAVPAGESVVRMTYDSWSFKIGLWVSSLTTVFLAAGVLGLAVRREA